MMKLATTVTSTADEAELEDGDGISTITTLDCTPCSSKDIQSGAGCEVAFPQTMVAENEELRGDHRFSSGAFGQTEHALVVDDTALMQHEDSASQRDTVALKQTSVYFASAGYVEDAESPPGTERDKSQQGSAVNINGSNVRRTAAGRQYVSSSTRQKDEEMAPGCEELVTTGSSSSHWDSTYHDPRSFTFATGGLDLENEEPQRLQNPSTEKSSETKTSRHGSSPARSMRPPFLSCEKSASSSSSTTRSLFQTQSNTDCGQVQNKSYTRPVPENQNQHQEQLCFLSSTKSKMNNETTTSTLSLANHDLLLRWFDETTDESGPGRRIGVDEADDSVREMDFSESPTGIFAGSPLQPRKRSTELRRGHNKASSPLFDRSARAKISLDDDHHEDLPWSRSSASSSASSKASSVPPTPRDENLFFHATSHHDLRRGQHEAHMISMSGSSPRQNGYSSRKASKRSPPSTGVEVLHLITTPVVFVASNLGLGRICSSCTRHWRTKEKALQYVRYRFVPRRFNKKLGHFPDYVAFWVVELVYERGAIRIGCTLMILSFFAFLFLNCTWISVMCFFLLWCGWLTVWTGFVQWVNLPKIHQALHALFAEEELSLLDLLIRRLKRGDLQYHVKRLFILVNFSLSAEEAQQVLAGCHPTFIRFFALSPQKFFRKVFRKLFPKNATGMLEYEAGGAAATDPRSRPVPKIMPNHTSEQVLQENDNGITSTFHLPVGPEKNVKKDSTFVSAEHQIESSYEFHDAESDGTFGGMLLSAVGRINAPSALNSPADEMNSATEVKRNSEQPDDDRLQAATISGPDGSPVGSRLAPGTPSPFRPVSEVDAHAYCSPDEADETSEGNRARQTTTRRHSDNIDGPTKLQNLARKRAQQHPLLDKYGRPRIVPILHGLVRKRVTQLLASVWKTAWLTAQKLGRKEIQDSLTSNWKFYLAWGVLFLCKRGAVALLPVATKAAAGSSSSLASTSATKNSTTNLRGHFLSLLAVLKRTGTDAFASMWTAVAIVYALRCLQRTSNNTCTPATSASNVPRP
ncbi:unnamed protein product [Amoebophrya sp. A120]|nr:unnamed protein product [Amoebophrya sp. A120]|eukprot:GSA120T00017469001.1